MLQELLHAYLPVGRSETLGAAMEPIAGYGTEAWPLEAEDVDLAHQLHERHPGLMPRDLCRLASCRGAGSAR